VVVPGRDDEMAGMVDVYIQTEMAWDSHVLGIYEAAKVEYG
jgi:hypothetical protein